MAKSRKDEQKDEIRKEAMVEAIAHGKNGGAARQKIVSSHLEQPVELVRTLFLLFLFPPSLLLKKIPSRYDFEISQFGNDRKEKK